MNILQLLEHGRNLCAAAGIAGFAWGAYASSGLPVPATIAQVDQRVASVMESVKGVKATALGTDRRVVSLQKNFLRNEKAALSKAVETAEQAARVSLARRLGEIDDAIGELDRDDAELRRKIQELLPR